MKNFIKKSFTVILTLAMLMTIAFLSGCSVELSAKGSTYYKNENGGDIYKSRAVEKQNSGAWSWGNAGK